MHSKRTRSLGRRRPGATSGFTLIELLISTTITLLLLVGTLSLFNMNSRVARIQGHVADMQQSLRVAQYDVVRFARMAGRGELPTRGAGGNSPLPLGLAVSLRNNVADDVNISVGNGGTPTVVEGTDVLTIRGVFSSPIVQLPASGAFTIAGSTGTINISSIGPTNIPQDLSEFVDAVNSGRPEAIMLVTPENEYGLVELDPSTSNVSDAENIVLGFSTSGGTHTTDYATLNLTGAFPGGIGNDDVVYVAVLEEYRYYIRETAGFKPGSGDPEIEPSLSRARTYPGTEAPHDAAASNWAVDIADNVLDLQIALGLDLDADGTVEEDTDAPDTDEWLFNSSGDDPNSAVWNNDLPLSYLRITSLARTDRRDLALGEQENPDVTVIEDHDFAAAFNDDNSLRQFHYRDLQTTVDLRNL